MVAESPQLLTIDCGNSTIRCRRQDGAFWSTSSREPNFDGLSTFVGPLPTHAVAVSVVPHALHAVRAALSGCPLVHGVAVAGEQLRCPLRLDYETVGTLGADRWLGAFAAYQQFGASITVDCGTATTVNLVTDDGVFRGGAIAPGLGAFVHGMAATAGALPAANLDADPIMPARSTQGCVDAGVLLGWAGLVERLMRDARRRSPDSVVVVTGGHANRLRRLAPWSADGDGCVFVADLLHDGLAALAQLNDGPSGQPTDAG